MARNQNASLSRLQALARSGERESRLAQPELPPSTDAMVYSYVVASTALDAASHLRQRGCGPNLQGDRITIATCKHRMRAAREVEEWPGQWIAGLSSRRLYEGRQWLFFLMQVEQAYPSQAALWQALPESVRAAKSARRSVFGDVFEPRRATISPDEALDPDSYFPPRRGHRHRQPKQPELWHRDVDHRAWQRPSALLVGHPERSLVWTEPKLFYKGELTQGHKKWPTLDEFLGQLAVAR